MLSDQVAEIVSGLAEKGYVVVDHFLTDDQVEMLADETLMLWQSGEFRHARIGHGENKSRHPEIRNDRIHWLDPLALSDHQQCYFDNLEALRLAINRELFLGLFEFEGHLALYPPGSFYGKHLDCFQDASHRVVTAILYLNDQWQECDGGKLRFYMDEGGDEANFLDVEPLAGRLVLFLSRRFFHEVLPAQKDRLSLTGWFRVRPLQDESKKLFISQL